MKNLTTGEMVNRLNGGDRAVNQRGIVVGYDSSGRLLSWREEDEMPTDYLGNEFQLDSFHVGTDMWDITPQFVTFFEAQEAFMKHKKTIIFYQHEELQYTFVPEKYGHFQQLGNDGVDLGELIEGRWIIVNRSTPEN